MTQIESIGIQHLAVGVICGGDMRLKVHLVNPFEVPTNLVDEPLLLELIQYTSAVASGLSYVLHVTYGHNLKISVSDNSIILDGVDEKLEAQLSKLGLICEVI